MNPFTATLNATGLRNKQHATDDFATAALAVLSLAEQLDANSFSGVDFYTEVTNRLLTTYGLPEYFVQKIDREIFQQLRSRLNRGL